MASGPDETLDDESSELVDDIDEEDFADDEVPLDNSSVDDDDFSDSAIAALPQPDRAKSIAGLPKVTVSSLNSSLKIKRLIR
jgi:hypothetical protein